MASSADHRRDAKSSRNRPEHTLAELRTLFDSIGLSLEEPLLAILRANGYSGPGAKVFIQSFETGNLRELNLLDPTSLVDDAHKAGLLVHPYTFRNENDFLPADFRLGNPVSPVHLRATGDAPAEYRLFFRLGVDGLFSDNSDTAVASRHQFFTNR